MYRTRKGGFTLVEILIVVIILGILAAIVIPQFTNASQDARKSNLASQVQTLKSQVELYKLQHQDKPPLFTGGTLTDPWDLFTKCTDDFSVVSSATNPQVPDATFTHGPYMQAEPTNPLTASKTIVSTGAATTTSGWTYDSTTGVIHGIAINNAGTAVETDDGIHDLTGAAIPY